MLNRRFGAFKPQRFRAARRKNAILLYGGGVFTVEVFMYATLCIGKL